MLLCALVNNTNDQSMISDNRILSSSIRRIFKLEYLFLIYSFYIHIIKTICHSYQDYVQMFTVAMETPTNNVKMPFCIIFNIFLLFPKPQIKISIPHKLLL